MGVGHQTEPPAWLPDGAARGIAEEEAGAGGESQDLAGGNDAGGDASPGAGTSYGAGSSAGSFSFGNENSFGTSGSFGGGSFGAGGVTPGAGETAGTTVPPPGEGADAGEDPISFEHPGAGPASAGAPGTYRADDGYHTGGPYDMPSFGGESSYPAASYEYGREGSYTATAASASGYLQQDSGAPAREDPMVRSYPGQAPYQGRPGGDTASMGPARPAGVPGGRPRRRANLVIARLEPWSVMKFSFLISLVAWVVLFVAVALLYFVLSALGVFHAVQSTLSSVTSSQGSGGFDLGNYVSASRILGYTMLLGAVNIVLITALSTIGAMIYNLVTHLGGGIEITLKEGD
ncbi:MAG: DUF3566 domain-containing protein [Nocardiopsaceae bacterium]|jgi:hypothetical protein|nr:DUF3566 domain-containing protein [Nocardiopsaceae bacterium]